MKQLKRLILILVISLSFTGIVKAQYYEMASHMTDMLWPALSGNVNYKGYVEASYLKGLGEERVDFVDISTTQGVKFAKWFYMGVGAAVDVMIPSTDFSLYKQDASVMVPLYADFRFLIGNQSNVSVNLDVRMGAAFVFDDFHTNNGYLLEDENFYLRPTLSVRFPINKDRPKQAISVGFSYQLLLNAWENGNYFDEAKDFHNVGATIGFEW